PAGERIQDDGARVAVAERDEHGVHFQRGETGQVAARPGSDRISRGLRRVSHGIRDAGDLPPAVPRQGLKVPPAHGPGPDQSHPHAHGSMTTFIESAAMDFWIAASTSASRKRWDTNSRTG